MKDIETNKYIFGKKKFVLSLAENCDYDISKLFSELDNKIYNEVMEKIEHFYSIKQYNSNDIYDLIYYSTNKIGNKESNIILNIVEHISEKIQYIYNNFDEYKQNLITLEKKIIETGKKTLNLDKNIKEIKRYFIDETKKMIFESLLGEIDKKIKEFYKGKFKLYPLGSITQFLGGNSSDIDMYLDIKLIRENYKKILFIQHLEGIIRSIIKRNPKVVISTRLCVISFKYKCFTGNETDFDISLMGFCPYPFHYN